MTPTDVLIADDSKLVTKLAAKALLSNNIEGYRFDEQHIHIAHDGMQAFEMLGAHPQIKLVISDINMPELNGDELIEILVDTNKMKDLEVVFMTTENVAAGISPITKRATLGTIHKPFNNISFCNYFNDLLQHKKQRNETKKQNRRQNAKHKRVVTTLVGEYCQSKDVKLDQSRLSIVLDVIFDTEDAIGKEELYTLFVNSIEDYLELIQGESSALDDTLLEEIYAAWENPSEVGELGVQKEIEAILMQARELLNQESDKEAVTFKLIRPLSKSLLSVQEKIKTRKQLPYDDFMPFFPQLVKRFGLIDKGFQLKRVTVLTNRVNELRELHGWLQTNLSEAALVREFPFLESNEEVRKLLKQKILQLSRFVATVLIPQYVAELDATIWKKAKKSAPIRAYLKSKFTNKPPNTHTFLSHFGDIEKSKMKGYEKYQREQVFVLSSSIDVLKPFKGVLDEEIKNCDIQAFMKLEMLQNVLDKKLPSKLIIDLNYADTVYQNGLQVVKYLKKKCKNMEVVLNNESLHLLATPQHLEILSKKKVDYSFSILLKPVNETNLYEKLFLDS